MIGMDITVSSRAIGLVVQCLAWAALATSTRNMLWAHSCLLSTKTASFEG